jgi:hypothetical protein
VAGVRRLQHGRCARRGGAPLAAGRVDLPRWEEIPEFARLLVIRRLAVLLARRAADRPAAGGERDEPAGLGSPAGQGHGGAL